MTEHNTPPIPPQDANDSGKSARTARFGVSGSGDTPEGPDRASRASIREAAEALIGQVDRAADLMPIPVDITNASEALRAMLDQPERSRPSLLPDVDHALGAIAAMKRGEPITPEDIRAIVALAETGADELAGFDLRWNADMRAIARWREAHPGNDLVLPDHADLVVWLMDVFDTTFSTPTVAQVENVRARLGAAQLRAPNALTKDARDIVDELADALRKTSRRAFMAEERARAAEAANVQWEQDDHRGITHQHVETHRVGMVERTTISTIYGGPDGDQAFAGSDHSDDARRPTGPASARAFDALIAEARKAGIVDDDAKTIWRQPGEAGALLATKLGQLTGYPVKDRTEPREWTPHNDYAGEPMPEGVFRDPPEGEDAAEQGNRDCLAKRRPGEPMFILLGRDPDAHAIVRTWALRRLAAGGDPEHVAVAVDLADRMEGYAANPANAPSSAPAADRYCPLSRNVDDWTIKIVERGHADTEGEAMAMFAHLDCPICGGSGHVDDGRELLAERLTLILSRELGDSWDCTRVWEAWSVGTMTQDDFEPVADRLDDLVESIVAQLTAPDLVEDDRASLDRVEARLDAEVTATAPAVVHPQIKAGHAVRVDVDGQRFEGVAEQDGRATLKLVGPTPDIPTGSDAIDLDQIGDKNTATYDRRQMEQRINDELAAIAARHPGERIGIDVAAEVARFAPGWDFQTVDSISSAFPKVVLTRYAPGEPA